jgi:hypothetical protein
MTATPDAIAVTTILDDTVATDGFSDTNSMGALTVCPSDEVATTVACVLWPGASVGRASVTLTAETSEPVNIFGAPAGAVEGTQPPNVVTKPANANASGV